MSLLKSLLKGSVTNIVGRSLLVVATVPLLTGAGLFGNRAQKGEGGTDVSDLAKCAEPIGVAALHEHPYTCLLYTSPSPRDATLSRMPSSA